MTQPSTPPPSGPAQPQRPRTAPLDVDGVRTAVVGTVVWVVAFVALLPFAEQLADDGRTWWLWTCATGAALGLLATWVTSRRRARLRARSRG